MAASTGISTTERQVCASKRSRDQRRSWPKWPRSTNWRSRRRMIRAAARSLPPQHGLQEIKLLADAGAMHRSQLSFKKRAEYFWPSTFEAAVALETAP
jgi:hypothetical protein